ncbi:MAG TPA: mechanosensitive ion channel domain-containing protein [Stellaceae bacterium]
MPESSLGNPTSAELLARMWNSTSDGLKAVPQLREAPAYWLPAIADLDHPIAVSLRFWLIFLGGLLAAPSVGSVTRRLFDRIVTGASWRAVSRLRIALLRLLIGLISLLVVAALLWIALVSTSTGNRLLEETADRIVWAIVEWRLAIIALTAVFSPRVGDLRLLRIDDSDAARCMRWLRIYAAIAPLDYCLIWLIERVGFAPQVVFGTALVLGTATTIYKIAMIWAIRRPIARAILAATEEEAPPLRRAIAASWHWVFILLALAIWAASAVAFSLGKGAAVYGAATVTQVIVIVLAIGWQSSQKLIRHLYAAAPADVAAGLRRQRFVDAARRLCDLLFVVAGLAWLGEVWGLNLIGPAPGSLEELVLRPILLALVTFIAAWIVWLLLSGVIDEKMPRLAGPGDEDDDLAERASRLGTLLPLLRNLTMVVIGIIAVAVALSTLGLDLAPILAGLGVIGIALGFGAQHLVRDIISGIFFLMEDAFRVGEYIDTGRLRGTVEGMSLRSVRLRHQNGPVHTIPFGQVQSVTNYSRDWSVVKFNLHLAPTVEIELVRKTVKRVGQELLEDPEIGGEFIQPLKMQGVIDVLQTHFVVRCKFTALPGRPTYLQRQALRRLIEAFGNAEIPFAAPNVMVQLATTSTA